MTTPYVLLPFLPVLTTFLLIPLLGEKRRNGRDVLVGIAAALQFILVLTLYGQVEKGVFPEWDVIQIARGISIGFKLDTFGFLFASLSSFLWIFTHIYSVGYMRSLKKENQTRYFFCFSAAMFAALGIAFSKNLLTMFMFYEILTLSTYPLVAHDGTPEARKGGKTYLVYLFGTSIVFLLLAVFITYNVAGTLDFEATGILTEWVDAQGNLLFPLILVGLFVAGIAKAAMIPFHSWLPAAMVAPAPVSALLHAVAVVKSGIFVLAKVMLNIFGVELLLKLGTGEALAYFASFTIIVASVLALMQDDLKRLLAYSTVSQLSYAVLGIALLTGSSITGSIAQIVVHAFGKITLFFAVGAIYVATHKRKVSEIAGIGRQMPYTMAAFSVAALSMIGVPPMGGFISKWYLALGAVESGHFVFLFVLAISTFLNACYFLPIIYTAYFKGQSESKRTGGQTAGREAPFAVVLPVIVTAAGLLVVSFVPSLFLNPAASIVAWLKGGM
jgi:multicomponent Na+:H+ antiporter subunit D